MSGNGSAQSQPSPTPHGADTEAAPSAWRSMNSAPRDGSIIIIAFGSDWTSAGSYHCNEDDPHPWKFIDRQGAGHPIFNGARDDKYGPTGWMPMPEWSSNADTAERQPQIPGGQAQ